ncbi:DUF4115 domain-containing protein [Pseudoroseomonas globiformis]|uniref:DUF4115 domain-containing protein n=1 Tax=Teichococcus globiformis TaxID=2307229 RepID=A0ABV7G305_9PROT
MILRAIQECWVQIRDPRNNQIVLSRLLRAGESYDVPAIPGLLLTTGRIEALVVEVGGTPSRAFAEQTGVRRDIVLDPERFAAAAPAAGAAR